MQSSDTRALFHLLAAGCALGQVITLLPRGRRGKAQLSLWLFLLVPLSSHLANVRAIRSSQQQSHPWSEHPHPAEILIDNARVQWESLVQHQSPNYTAASMEYRRRYHMEPPDGFEEWYNFATLHQSPLIDDFDTIYHAVSPFWRRSGVEVLQVMEHVKAHPATDVWSCVYSSQKAMTRCHHPHRRFDRHITTSFNRLLGTNVSMTLPDVEFLVNHLDEPRVLIPPPSTSTTTGHHPRGRRFDLTEMSHRSTWESLTRYCASDSEEMRKHTDDPFNLLLPFVTDISSTIDLCQHPEYQTSHGLLMSPTSFRLIEGSVPVLSTGSLSTMGDILYPSPAYFEDEFHYDGAKDVDWEEKRNNLYWAGSTTGGYATDDSSPWRHFHRQRFVSLAQHLEPQKLHIYLRHVHGAVTRVASTFLNARLYDVAFTKVFQCTMSVCRSQYAHFRTHPWADRYRAFRSRLAFDMDGNGISGRYHQLVASKSVPLKQTLLREWHDDRLVPWAHYIPVSQGMDELPELVTYFTTSDIGQRKAREVAELGREWYSKAFREVDFTIYLYRLMLEMARLQDPKRKGGMESAELVVV